jgi:tetratricopeptide (TPR) repeat protein
MLHSVWGTVYVNVWADSFRETDVIALPAEQRAERRWWSLMALLGLLPTALFLGGTGLAARDVWRGHRRPLYIPILILMAGGVAGFVAFTWVMPRWPGLKSSYLLALSLPYGVFLARGAEVFALGGPRVAVAAGVAAVSAVATWGVIPGAVLPVRADAPATGAVRFQFGEYEDARRLYLRLVAGAPGALPWIENLAAVELAAGNTSAARVLYARAVAGARLAGIEDPYRDGRLAVAMAVDGDLEAARAILDHVSIAPLPPELLANRGALHAARGQFATAEDDLREALAAEPELLPAWRNLALVLEADGRREQAATARDRAVEIACGSPRRYPHGLGTGEILEWGVGRRWLLLLDGGNLRVALPAFYREACRKLAGDDWRRLAPGSFAPADAT